MLHCPKEIELQQIHFPPLMKIMKSIHLFYESIITIPDHLYNENLGKQQNIYIIYDQNLKRDIVDNALLESNIPLYSIV